MGLDCWAFRVQLAFDHLSLEAARFVLLRGKVKNHNIVFAEIYDRNHWGYGSGGGSLASEVEPYVSFLAEYLQVNDIH